MSPLDLDPERKRDALLFEHKVQRVIVAAVFIMTWAAGLILALEVGSRVLAWAGLP